MPSPIPATSRKKKNPDPAYDCWGRLRWWSCDEAVTLYPIVPQQEKPRLEAEAMALKLAKEPSSTRSVYWWWVSRVGPKMAYQLARWAYTNNREYTAYKKIYNLSGRLSL